jgi:hypothetical protein
LQKRDAASYHQFDEFEDSRNQQDDRESKQSQEERRQNFGNQIAEKGDSLHGPGMLTVGSFIVKSFL